MRCAKWSAKNQTGKMIARKTTAQVISANTRRMETAYRMW